MADSVYFIYKYTLTKALSLTFFSDVKTTGNFLTLSQVVDKYSADGEYRFLTLLLLSVPSSPQTAEGS